MKWQAGAASIAAIGMVLTACSSEEETPAAEDSVAMSAEDVQSAAEGIVKPQPGQYTSKMEVLEFDVPGLPPEQADMMKSMMEGLGEQTASYCLTEEEVGNGFQDMVEASQDGDCTFDKFDTTAGTIDAAMTCKTPQGDAKATLSGTATPTKSEMTINVDQQMPGVANGGRGKITMKLVNERVGDCS